MPDTPIKRSRKRVIRRDQLPASKLANTKKPPPKPKKPQPAIPKVPITPPSDLRATSLNNSLSDAFEVWRTHKPLALNIEQEIFRFIAANHISASKRVVQKMLRQKTRTGEYLRGIVAGEYRYRLDGSEAETITQAEQEHATRVLAA